LVSDFLRRISGCLPVQVSIASRCRNTVEGFYSIFKRGMKGVYQHCSEKHLHRYLVLFDFRYSNRAKLGIGDAMRADIAMKGIVGKRLMYRRPNVAFNQVEGA
jgi:hypothetical protein